MNTIMIVTIAAQVLPIAVEVILAFWFIGVLNDIRAELRRANKYEEDKASREWYAAHNRNTAPQE